ncbi:ABC transporter permease [Chitinophaga oryzae]|uniref:ABC transporter permease n=1 Tax=Chitinophaga oryzae TaxID=2725414 RepID=A0AAE7D5F9_9BACT|nr:ABC transporter permease [Chitinophaga oryzae]QJB30014.1 ABC transporter permease [Chitinophaga oryzae]QJB36511.1 ABC transporter permease [Chitinophaga oryzae]
MITNYIRTAVRSLWKNKVYSFLNIFGLMTGIACAGIIFLWVEDEVQYDSMHEKKDRLYAVLQHWQYDGYKRTFWSTPALMGPAIQAEFPGVARTCRTTEGEVSAMFSNGQTAYYSSGMYADSTLFSMFTFPFVEGDAQSAFTQPNSLVITETAARKFFGQTANVRGKLLKMDNQQEYMVTGVLKDLPQNSTLRFEWLAPFQTYLNAHKALASWDANAINSFVELVPGADVAALNRQLAGYVKEKFPKAICSPFLFSMNDWRLRNEFTDGRQTGGRIGYVRLFTVIGWIIIFIACINFMNLATARSEKRSKEVGVRKVLGAGKGRLVIQFIGEAMLMSLLAAVLAVAVISLLLPAFNAMVGKQIGLGLQHPAHWVALLAIALVTGLVAGSYPSLYLSSFNPVKVLKGIKTPGGSAAFIRKGLVTVQFTVSIVLIVSTIIIYQQIEHVKQRKLGYNKDNLLEMDVTGRMGQDFAAIRQDLLNTGLIENVALSDHATIYGGNNTNAFRWPGSPENGFLISHRSVTPGFFFTSGMELTQGRDFLSGAAVDSFSVVITESLSRLMGAEGSIGRNLLIPDDEENNYRPYRIVGIVKDYVYGNMYGKPDPVAFFKRDNDPRMMYVRIAAKADPEQAVKGIEQVMAKDNPGYPFAFRFVDEQFNAMFSSEQMIGRLSRVFASLAIVISCLGLFGLAAYTAERRTKEIGIRKVLGASVAGIARLLSVEFLKLVMLSAVIAFPLAWGIMAYWLDQFSYRTAIHWWVFVLAGGMAVVIALATVSYQAVRTAMRNPVKSLQTM